MPSVAYSDPDFNSLTGTADSRKKQINFSFSPSSLEIFNSVRGGLFMIHVSCEMSTTIALIHPMTLIPL